MKRTQKITMAEIGRLAGVSQATVSRVINQPHIVKKELREKVEKLIEEYNFIPNENAKTMRGHGSKIIGLIAFGFSNYFYLNMAKFAEKIAREHGYSLLIMNSEKSSELELEHIKMMLARAVEGILITPVDKKNLEYLQKKKVPYVALNNEFVGHNYVTTSLSQGGELACMHFLEQGFDRVGYVGQNDENTGSKLDGVKLALKMEGLKFKNEDFLKVDTIGLKGDEIDKYIEEGKIKCKAYIASNDEVACLFMKKLTEKGIRVPEDVAIVGFDNTIVAELLDITSVTQPVEEMIKKGIGILLDSSLNKVSIYLTPGIEIRKSSLKVL